MATSSPASRRTVTAVERTGTTVRVNNVLLPPPEGGGPDPVAPLWLWAPLGDLAPGWYTVELYDADVKECVVTRRVQVPKPEPGS